MTLRKRLILFFITLIGLLGLAQWWLLSTLTEQLEEGRRQDAVEIGKAVFDQLIELEAFPPPGRIISEHGLPPGLLEDVPVDKLHGQGGIIIGSSSSMEWEVIPRNQLMDEEWADGPGATKISVMSTGPLGPDGEPIAFDLDLPFAADPIDRRLQEFRSGLILGTALILLLALLAMTIAAHKIGVPLRQLATTARKVESGRFGETVAEGGGAEVGEVIQAFNSMSSRLEELQDETDRLREREHLTELGELARGLAHAMRNPLHVIGLSAQRLSGEELDDVRRAELARSVQSQVQRVDRAMRNFLALSSAGQGHLQEVSLTDVCRDVALELMQGGGPVPEIKIDAQTELPTLLAVSAEVRALVHVLMTNAVEAASASLATEGADTPPAIQVHLTTDEQNRLQIEILDRGPGIADDLRDKLFTPHFTTKEHGAGLGLYLAQRIAVNRYGGSVELSNRVDGGCRAVLSLKPLQLAAINPLEAQADV